ncbi:hypothetical protein AAEX63_10545 [Luteococcus sp. H138]|uniref:hypothetical protein n=1 Tax=unclassified Luteococcus TaxID=2639923 RepID=UPI00313B3C3A
MRRISALFLALVCAGCVAPTPAESPATTTSGPATPQETAASPAASASGTPPTTDPPVATREVSKNGFRLALDLYPLRRAGESALLTARLRVLERPADELVNADDVLSGGGFVDGIQGRTNGFSLVDAPRKVLLRPATADGAELCEPTFHGGWQKGDVYWVSCIFGAPHQATSQITVRAATFGSFDRVPVR